MSELVQLQIAPGDSHAPTVAENLENKASSERRVDLTSFEEWIASVPAYFDVLAWTHNGEHLWPLFKTALIGLAIVATMGHRRFGLTTGGLGWQLGVLADYFGSPIVRRCFATPPLLLAPPEGLSGRILCCDSGGHARAFGEMLISPSLDVIAASLMRRGRHPVFWFENSSNGDPRLLEALHRPAYGLGEVLGQARRYALHSGVRGLDGFPGFSECCQVASRHLGLPLPFLRFWIKRQFNLALSIARAYDRAFCEHGCPELLLISNSCVWSTTGLISAARKHRIPVIEVHHGVESPSAVTAPRQLPHFSQFNSVPDALITWEQIDRGDKRVFAAGPLGIHLGGVISDRDRNDPQTYSRFVDLLNVQRQSMSQRTAVGGFRAEVLVSLQPGDNGKWVEEIVRALRGEVFFWLRRHARDDHKRSLSVSRDIREFTDSEIASSALLAVLLERVDIHLTRFSAVTLEAAALGVPTIATDPYAKDLFDERLPKHMFSIAQSADAIAECIERLIAQKRARVRPVLPDLNRLVSFIDDVAATSRGLIARVPSA